MNKKINTSIDAVIGLILSNIRKNKKISQENAAKCIGLTKQAISNMENGRSKFSVAQVYQLCGLYKVHPEMFFEILNEAISNHDINIHGVNDTIISSIDLNLKLESNNEVENQKNFVSGVILAGFLGSTFMEKITNLISDTTITSAE